MCWCCRGASQDSCSLTFLHDLIIRTLGSPGAVEELVPQAAPADDFECDVGLFQRGQGHEGQCIYQITAVGFVSEELGTTTHHEKADVLLVHTFPRFCCG